MSTLLVFFAFPLIIDHLITLHLYRGLPLLTPFPPRPTSCPSSYISLTVRMYAHVIPTPMRWAIFFFFFLFFILCSGTPFAYNPLNDKYSKATPCNEGPPPMKLSLFFASFFHILLLHVTVPLSTIQLAPCPFHPLTHSLSLSLSLLFVLSFYPCILLGRFQLGSLSL
jgi:hypothetical protein